jgi:hypothetical protein
MLEHLVTLPTGTVTPLAAPGAVKKRSLISTTLIKRSKSLSQLPKRSHGTRTNTGGPKPNLCPNSPPPQHRTNRQDHYKHRSGVLSSPKGNTRAYRLSNHHRARPRTQARSATLRALEDRMRPDPPPTDPRLAADLDPFPRSAPVGLAPAPGHLPDFGRPDHALDPQRALPRIGLPRRGAHGAVVEQRERLAAELRPVRRW